jgi:ubiquinone/menaquinone biosynthesis C-methylase UbiE/spore maturation protein CgeB
VANADRISEVYKGEIWDDALQQRARNRIHWLAGHARGRVLDVGCSQGIASLLVAREGLRVVGVDVELDRVAYALADREKEEPEVAQRTAFLGASATALPFADDSFDTVLLGEILEHLEKPEAVLDEVARVLAPGGTVAITVPFGLSPHHDHRDTFYAANLLGLVGGHLLPQSIEIVERYLRIVATNGVADPPRLAELLASVQPAADRLFEEVERSELDGRASMRELARRSRQLAESERQVERLTTTLARAERRLEIGRANLREMEYQRDSWRWKFESLKRRRPLRALVEIKKALSSPVGLLKLPVTLVRVLFGPSPANPYKRPEREATVDRPAVVDKAASEQRRDIELQIKLLAPRPPVTLKDLRVAAVLDTFSESSFGPECDLVTFRPDNAEAVLTRQLPHLLLVESAWQGNGGAWQYQVGTYNYAESVGVPHLSALVAWCREREIPTVFWNKEDPVHFDKFKQAAQLFDIVLTTDADCVERYRGLPKLRATEVAALPFAAQPRLHNPISLNDAREAIPVFGGTYYRNRHPERRAQLEMLLDAARPSGLVIFDRTFGQQSDGLGFPERFTPHIRGGLPYDEMVAAYKRYRVFLNTNSVTQSPTMFSRRVFELLACGTPVVSTPSVGMQQLFGDIVAAVDDETAARSEIERLLTDDTLWHQRSAAGIRRVHGQHTYAHRLASVAELAGYRIPPFGDERVAVLMLADASPGRALDSIVSQTDRPHEVIVGGATSALASSHVTVIEQPADRSRVERFAELAAATEAPWVLIADGTHSYRLDHLADLAVARRWTHADIIGVDLPGGSHDHHHGHTHRYVDRVEPHGALVRRELVAEHGWDDRSAEQTQAELSALGATLYGV